MHEKIKSLMVFCVRKISLIIVTAVFFIFQCSDPLSFLLADTTLMVDKNKVLLYEGESNTIGFRLNAKLFNDEKFVTLTASLECEGLNESERTSRATIDKKTITWKTNNWATWQKFVLVAIENDKQEISKTCKLLLEPIQSNDVGFDKLKMKEIPITILDNDGDANIKVNTQNLALAEAETNDANGVNSTNVSYTINLTKKPRDEVTINIIHKEDLPSWFPPPKLIVSGTPATSVTFTAENYKQPQTITVSYPNDMYADGSFIHTLQHTITTRDPIYKKIALINLPEVTLDLRDNDTLNFQIINNQDNALISSLEGREGMTQSFKIKPSVTLREGTIIKLNVSAANSDRILLADSSSPYSAKPVRLTFRDNNPQIVNINFIDDLTTTAASLLTTTIRYSVITSGPDAPIVNGIFLSPQGGFASIGGSLKINIIDNVPGIRVTDCNISGVGINRIIEGGYITCNLQLRLAIAMGSVTVNVTPNAMQNDPFIMVNPSSLTFTPTNWNIPQQILIQSISNNIDQENYIKTVTFRTPSTGQPGGYNNKEKQVSLSITDDDTDSFSGSFSIPNQAVNVLNSLIEGDSGIFSVCLTADPKDSMNAPATVSFKLQSSDSNILGVINPNFSLNVKGCHNFNLTAPNNNIIGDTHSVTLTILTFNNGGDTDYTLAQLSTVIGGNTIISIIDDDIPSVIISISSLTILEGGLTQTYTIGLPQNALPSSGENVVIDLSTNHTLLTVTPAQLTLNSANTSQSVTVTRTNNNIDEDDGLVGTISHTLNPSTGASYNITSVQNAVSNSNIEVTMNDNDMAGFIFMPTNGQVNVTEGGSVNYTVELSSEPIRDVVLEINPDSSLMIGSPTSLTFTPSNWSIPQTITVQAIENNDVGDYDTQVSHSVNSADFKYNSSTIAPGQVTVHVEDNDGSKSVLISKNMLTFDDIAGETGDTYSISLSHDPASGKEVKVNITSLNNTLQVAPNTVTFTNTTGRNPKTITVKRKNDLSNIIVADITGIINHTIVTTGTNSDLNITTFQGGSTVNVTVNSTAPIIDFDHDGLIDINNAMMLNNMRYNLAGTSYKTLETPLNGPGNVKGCPTSGCNGYELTANIDLESLLDKNRNGMIDTTTVGIDKNADGDMTDAGEQITAIDTGMGKDTSWMPIGDNSTDDDKSRFTGIFEGNNHTIENLWVRVRVNAGLFGATEGKTTIRNVGIISGSVSSSSYSGSLVGIAYAPLTISNSYFSGSGGIFSTDIAGGLVGYSAKPLTISNSYFSGSGGIFSTDIAGGLVGYSAKPLTISNSYFSGSGGIFSTDIAGGLVGYSAKPLTISNSYFSGSGGVFCSSPNNSSSGGLVGRASSPVTITNSYFSGSGGVFSYSSNNTSSYSGGLIGYTSTSLTITKFYWNTDAPQKITNGMTNQNPKRAQGNATLDAQGNLVDASGAIGLTLMQLKAITSSTPSAPSPSDLPHSATDNTKAWDLGDADQLPAIKLCVPTITGTGSAATTNWTTCASYGALLPGQR